MNHSALSEISPPAPDRASRDLMDDFVGVRGFSGEIASPLSAEDCSIQSMDDASPTRWHLAHTTWFFETFLLKTQADYKPFDAAFEYLFNSYYNTVGEQFPRGKRGLVSRPSLEETYAYRDHVDDEMVRRFDGVKLSDQQRVVLETGINHEQQHQELMLTDIKHALSCNPLDPVYRPAKSTPTEAAVSPEWIDSEAGIARVGYEGEGFCFDNERPRHRVFLEPFQIARRCVTNGEYMEFMGDGGYERPEFWLSLGWSTVGQQGWDAPLYWRRDGSGWSQFTLAGRRPIDPDEPVCHVSYFEADAYARWAGFRLGEGFRLPTEAEWELVVCQSSIDPYSSNHDGVWSDTLIGSGHRLHPRVSADAGRGAPVQRGEPATPVPTDALGNLWEWTSSHYSAYPGYRPASGALGEYNGKFMCNVFVLKGGSCATPSKHVRPTYRNFFSPESRWQFSGIRLARS